MSVAPRPSRLHSGATLIELLLYVALLGIVISAILPLLFAATEERLLQQTISIVEQNGAQIIQSTTHAIRKAERVLTPAAGQQTSVLGLQTASGPLHPVIIGLNSGSVMIVRHTTLERLSSPQVAITNFRVRNTSTSATRQSVVVSFRVSRTIRLQQPYSYERDFEFAVTLYPDDVTQGNSCNCLPPYCLSTNVYAWEVCENNTCLDASTPLKCP